MSSAKFMNRWSFLTSEFPSGKANKKYPNGAIADFQRRFDMIARNCKYWGSGWFCLFVEEKMFRENKLTVFPSVQPGIMFPLIFGQWSVLDMCNFYSPLFEVYQFHIVSLVVSPVLRSVIWSIQMCSCTLLTIILIIITKDRIIKERFLCCFMSCHLFNVNVSKFVNFVASVDVMMSCMCVKEFTVNVLELLNIWIQKLKFQTAVLKIFLRWHLHLHE